jgi:hypothetical protein
VLLARAAAAAVLGGLTVGVTIGNIPGVIQSSPAFDAALHPSDRDREVIGSMMQAGAILGAVVGGLVCDRLGRRVSIAVSAVLLMGGALVCLGAAGSGERGTNENSPTMAVACERAVDCSLIGFVDAEVGAQFCAYYSHDACPRGAACVGRCDRCSECWGDADALAGSCAAECGGVQPAPASRGVGMASIKLGRFVAGMGMGAASHSVPVYTSEVAAAAVRGALGASFQVFPRRLGADVKVILTPPCIFCTENC